MVIMFIMRATDRRIVCLLLQVAEVNAYATLRAGQVVSMAPVSLVGSGK